VLNVDMATGRIVDDLELVMASDGVLRLFGDIFLVDF